MRTGKLLSAQMAATYREKNWFVPLRMALKGLSAEEAKWKPSKRSNSIYEILFHLNFWNERYLQRFKGLPTGPSISTNEESFGGRNKGLTAALLKKEIKRAESILKEFERAVSKSSDVKLKSIKPKEIRHPWDSVIMNINLHNAYHAGQILMLRKLKGNWDSKKHWQ
ncbi:MAG TPA: DinB family protein [Bacteroidia bacterium]|jgi:uncharacterized damage-inducible protein DinB